MGWVGVIGKVGDFGGIEFNVSYFNVWVYGWYGIWYDLICVVIGVSISCLWFGSFVFWF